MTAIPSNLAPITCDATCCTAPPRAMPWLRLAIGLFVAVQTMAIGLAVNITPPDDLATRKLIDGAMLAATIVVIALLGWPLVIDAAASLRSRRITMELLFLAGIGGAMGVSLQSMRLGGGPVYFDTVSVLLTVYSVGRAISQHSRQRAMDAVASMRDVATVARRFDSGIETEVPSTSIRIGDRIRVYPGELVPIDGVIEAGESFVRQTPFTGEIISRGLRAGDDIASGSGVEDGSVVIRATANGDERKLDRLVDLVEQAATQSPTIQRQADRFVQWFLPAVLIISVASFAYWTHAGSLQKGLYTSLAVLLVACPCAAGLAAPLTLWITLARWARLGLIASSGDAIERLATAKSAVFDKTGTLASDTLELKRVTFAEGVDEDCVRAMVAAVEGCSSHPVAKLLAALWANQPLAIRIDVVSFRTLPGRGVEAVLRETERTCTLRIERRSSQIEVLLDEALVASIEVAELLRPSAAACLRALSERSLPATIMTGDSSAGVSASLAPTRAGMTPQEKLEALRSLPQPLYVGDGVNDAPSLAAAHASIALASGSTLAVATASATLHGGDLSVIPQAIDLARHAVRLIRSNLRWAIAYNLVGVVLAAMGWLHPVAAALLMGVSSAVVSFRAFRESPADVAASPVEGQTDLRRAPIIRRVLLLCWMLQGALLIPILGLSAMASVGLMVGFGLIAIGAVRRYAVMPAWLDMTVAMVAVGGLGMNLGWWADLGFTTGGAAVVCCATAGGALAMPWMYVGMVVLGTPAMYLLRRTPVLFSWKYWCCIGPIVVGIPAMIGGMWLGSVAATAMTVGWQPHWAGLIDASFMLSGMALGMLIPCAFGNNQARLKLSVIREK